MKAYSNDLREKIAAACQRPGQRQYAVAAQFGVSLSFVAKLLRRQRTSGRVAAKPWAGRRGAWTRPRKRACWPCWRSSPTRRWPNCATRLRERGQRVSLGTVWRVLTEHDWRRKKNAPRPVS